MYQYNSLLASPMVMPAPTPQPPQNPYQPPQSGGGMGPQLGGYGSSSFASYLSPRRNSLPNQGYKSRQDHYTDFMDSWMGQGSFDPYIGNTDQTSPPTIIRRAPHMGYQGMSRPSPSFSGSDYPQMGYVNPMMLQPQAYQNFRRVPAMRYSY